MEKEKVAVIWSIEEALERKDDNEQFIFEAETILNMVKEFKCLQERVPEIQKILEEKIDIFMRQNEQIEKALKDVEIVIY